MLFAAPDIEEQMWRQKAGDPEAPYGKGRKNTYVLTLCLLVTTKVVLIRFNIADSITVIGNEMTVQTSIFVNVRSQIKGISVIFSQLKLWVAWQDTTSSG